MNRFKMILIGCVGLFALLIGSGNLHAQASDADYSSGLFAEPTQTLVNSDQAKVILEGKIAELKEAIANMNHGTPEFHANDIALYFYGSVLGAVENGETVSKSLVVGVENVANYYDEPATPNELAGLRQQGINLLRQ